ncbi:conserved hypothetical protein [Pediculus humanus corporis]|uniref:AAA+ ATPase domain-containing protein n=1 Tax=Pediculus humanus subsp. corporis TaxID=121224 RepID=E0VVZ4_PEDHC|nr:uncharacterized protein Phum_PHUM472440 [Pediculus humanus corporis]EEB17550.1 conserved hypothetical protein [Pediculus humanus corporis]
MGDQAYQILQKELFATVVKMSIMVGVSYFTISWFLKKLDINGNRGEAAKKKAAFQLKKIGKTELKLTEHELMIASHLIAPSEIDVSWKDVGGLENVLDDIVETVIFPITKSKLLGNSKLTRPPKGVLLHGPPGCGKTLIAKATAKEAKTSFINLDISILTDKWYGESQKLVSALFSLASKLQPCIIFIDEIDSLLRSRTSRDHEATAMMKAQFMFLWDGLMTDPDKIVIIMGATNRPQDIDSAILRRMPATFMIPMPNKVQRTAILKLILEKENTEKIEYNELGNKTNGFSGSDLHELCRVASLCRIREFAKKFHSSGSEENETEELRPMNMKDLEDAIESINNSKLNYLAQLKDVNLD